MDLGKSSYWEDIWKKRSYIEKCKVLHLDEKSIKVEDKSRKIKKVNEKSNLRVNFDDTLKADNPILLIASRGNEMTSWMVRNFISKEENVLKIYKTLLRPYIEYSTQACAPLLRNRIWNIIMRLEGIQSKVTLVEGDLKAPFSLATTPRWKGGRYSIPWIAPLYSWSLPYNAEC